MINLRKAAEMALEVMEYNRANGTPNMGAAIQALRQALLQPEQKPVAIVNEGMGGIEWLDKPLPDDTPLYTAPPKREWVGLTDDERQEIVKQEVHWSGICRSIEDKLKEKNNG